MVDRLEIPDGSFVVAAARHIAAGRVTLEQLQLLGRYESRSAVEMNARRHVELGFFDEVDRGVYVPTEEFRTASIVVLDVQARAAEDLWAGTVDLAQAAASGSEVVATVAPPVAAPAFAAQRADHDVTPSSPVGQLLAFVTELRYLRSDLHAHALAAHGLIGPTARAVDHLWKGRHLSADDLRRLRSKDLISGGDGGWELTDAGRDARESAQAATEMLSAVAFDSTPDRARTALFAALARLPGEDPRPVIDR